MYRVGYQITKNTDPGFAVFDEPGVAKDAWKRRTAAKRLTIRKPVLRERVIVAT